MHYDSKDQLIEALKRAYKEEGVALTIKRSSATSLLLKCDLGGSYRPVFQEQQPKRKSSSRLTGCEFEITCGTKKGKWYVRKTVGSHNHPLDCSTLISHPTFRRLDDACKERIHIMHNSGCKAKDILTNVKIAFPEIHCTIQEIYNCIGASRRAFLNGRTPLEALLELVSTGDYIFRLWLKDDIAIGLFIVYKPAIEFSQRFGTVFLMDCTYKTNKFGMPLLNVVGITNTYQTFNAGFAFLPNELESSYVWALTEMKAIITPKVIATDRELALMNAIKHVFPGCFNVLCTWHINKNVLANCKRQFLDDKNWNEFRRAWGRIVYSASESELKDAMREFQNFSSSNPISFNYVIDNWMPFKEHFVLFYIKNIRHFGCATTTRFDENHHALKSYIKLGNYHPLDIVKRLTKLWNRQLADIKKETERQQLVVSRRHNLPLLSTLSKRISHFALDLILKQTTKPVQKDEPCAGILSGAYGIPCSHKLQNILENEQCVDYESVDAQWRLDTPLPVPLPIASKASRQVLTPRKAMIDKVRRQLYDSSNSDLVPLLAHLKRTVDTSNEQIHDFASLPRKRGRPDGASNKNRVAH